MEDLKPNKPSSTFDPESFSRVAKAIFEKFKVNCIATQVENHLKNEWQIISKLHAKSGFGWDDELKMIMAPHNVYVEEVRVWQIKYMTSISIKRR